MYEYSTKYGLAQKRLSVFVVFIGLLISQNVLAQHPSEKGWFEANFVKGCPGYIVTITHTRTGSGTLFYGFEGDKDNRISGTDFIGSFDEGETATFQYNDSGTFYIVVVDQSGSGSTEDRTDILEITVIPNQAPTATYTNCQGNTIQLQIDNSTDPFDSYNILWGDGAQENYAGGAPIEHTYTTPGVYDIFIGGRFNDGESSSCQLLKIEVSTFEELPTPDLEEVNVLSETEIELVYQPLSNGLSYVLQIDEGAGFTDYSSLDPQSNETSITINDSNLDTFDNIYGFKLMVEDVCSTVTKESEAGYTIGFEITNSSVSTTYDVTLEWKTSTQNFSSIDLLLEDNPFRTYSQAENSSGEILNLTNCGDLGTFTMTTDINNVVSTSIVQIPFESAPAMLPATIAPNAEVQGVVVELSFPSTIFDLGEYIIFRKDINPDFQEVFRSTSTNFTDTTIPAGASQVCYKLAYEDECGNRSELSDEICLVLSTSLGIPTAFSPNGDGVNDIFKINDGIYNNFKIAIFNRWGTVVFNSEDPTIGWNGEFEGQPVNGGTYLYQISFQNADNLLITQRGSFVLIR